MKRINKNKEEIRRRANKRERQRLARQGKHWNPLKRKRLRFGNCILLRVPDHVTLFDDENYDALSKIVKEFRYWVLERQKKVLLDFSSTQTIKASALTKLNAEIEVANSKTGRRAVSCRLPRKGRIRNLIRRSGFAGYGGASEHPGVLRIQSHSAEAGKPPPLKQLFKILNKSIYDGRLVLSDDEWQLISGPLAEAISNVQEHAYEHVERSEVAKSFGKRWWLYAETHDDQLFICFYDKGVGIPRTLEHHADWLALSRLVRRLSGRGLGNDSSRLKAAMEYGKSRVKRHGRGKGLGEIRDLVACNPQGELYIFSNRGALTLDAADGSENYSELSMSIHGTLIQWNISLVAGGRTI